ncbi:MAG: flagellar assembly protein FliH [Betaproteobacteria bacterium]
MAAPTLIPKEQLSAYERWEMSSFDKPAARKAPVSLTTAAQVEKIHLEGYQAGLTEGRQHAKAEAANFTALAVALAREVGELDQAIGQQVLDVALEVARQMLRTVLATRHELVLPVVQEAIRSLPVLGEDRRLRLHPQDATLVRELAGEALRASAWNIVEDPTIARGGCVVSSSHGEVDATLDARWRRIVGALGRDEGWLNDGSERTPVEDGKDGAA